MFLWGGRFSKFGDDGQHDPAIVADKKKSHFGDGFAPIVVPISEPIIIIPTVINEFRDLTPSAL